MVDFTVTQNILNTLQSKNVELSINNVKASLNSVATKGDILNITPLTGFDLYTFSTANGCGYIQGQNPNTGQIVKQVFKLVNNKLGSLTYADSSTNLNVINAYTQKAVVTPVFYYTDVINNSLIENKVNLLINGVNANLNDSANVGDVLTLIANDGYEFYLNNNNNSSSYLYEQDPNTGGLIYKYFTISDDKKTATYTITSAPAYATYWGLKSTTTATTLSSHNNECYIISDDDLKSINNNRYGRNSTNDIIDYGNAILSLIDIPFKIPD